MSPGEVGDLGIRAGGSKGTVFSHCIIKTCMHGTDVCVYNKEHLCELGFG